MYVEIDHQDAADRHPELADELTDAMADQVDAGVDPAPASFSWAYLFALRMNTRSFAEVLEDAGDGAGEPDEEVPSVEERLTDLRGRVHVHLQASRGEAFHNSPPAR